MNENLIINKSKLYNLRYRLFFPLFLLLLLLVFLFIEKDIIGRVTLLILSSINLIYIIYISKKKALSKTPNITLTKDEIIFNYDSSCKRFNYNNIKIKIGWSYAPSGLFDVKQEYKIYSLDKQLLHSEYISYYDITEFEFIDYVLKQSNKKYDEIFIEIKR